MKKALSKELEATRRYFRYVGTHGLLPQHEPPLLKPPDLFSHSDKRPLVYKFDFQGGGALDLEKFHKLIMADSLSKKLPISVTYEKGNIFSVVVGRSIRVKGEQHSHYSQHHAEGFTVSLDPHGLRILQNIIARSITHDLGQNRGENGKAG